MRSLGSVDAIAATGKVWAGTGAMNMKDMFFRELQLADKSIQISSFSTGHKSNEMDRLFEIIEAQLENPQMKINIIINDDKNDKTVTPYARKRITNLKKNFPERFFPQFFEQTVVANSMAKILHAKITVIDGKTAMIGSANLSKSALESNYEIMLKISGHGAARLSEMLSCLSEQIRCGTA